MPANTGRPRTAANKNAGALRSTDASPDTSATEQGTQTVAPKEDELTPEQQEIRRLKDELAKAKGAKDPEPEFQAVSNPGDEKNILIHFVRDGFCDLGAVWYKGQELELEPGTPNYDSAKQWAGMDSTEQEEVYGAVYFRQGPWKGKDYEDEAAAKAERRRNRAAPSFRE